MITLDFESFVRPSDGQENLGRDQFCRFPLDVVFFCTIENGKVGLIENIVSGIANEVSPLLPPIMMESYFPFLLQRLDCRWERNLVQGDQVFPQGFVTDVLKE